MSIYTTEEMFRDFIRDLVREIRKMLQGPSVHLPNWALSTRYRPVEILAESVGRVLIVAAANFAM